jgi:hypothetical protein
MFKGLERKMYLTREERNKYNYNLTHKTIDGVEYKQCSRCKEWLPMNLENFYRLEYNKSDGLSSMCKNCCIKDVQSRYDPNKKSNYDKKHYKKKMDYYKDKQKRNYKRNIESYKKAFSDWRKLDKNKDKLIRYAKNHRIHDITEAEWRSCLKVFNYKCAYCGISEKESIRTYKQKLHKEHADDDGYNDLRNAIPACKSCNSYKHQDDMEEWYKQQTYFSSEKLQFIYWWTNEGYKQYIEDKPPYRILREKNEENNKYHFNLWSVDEMRNLVDIIATKPKKKDLQIDIEQYLLTLN